MSESSESAIGAVLVFLAGHTAGFIIKIVVDEYDKEQPDEALTTDDEIEGKST